MAFVIDIMVWIVNRISTPVAAGRGRDEGIDQVVRINVAQTLTKYLTCIWYDLTHPNGYKFISVQYQNDSDKEHENCQCHTGVFDEEPDLSALPLAVGIIVRAHY